ncbi:MAG: hypothetical protein ACYC4L_17595 [Chloroflexota bacterium]
MPTPREPRSRQDRAARLDEEGRLPIPPAIRKAMGLRAGDGVYCRSRGGVISCVKVENPFDSLAQRAALQHRASRTKDLRAPAADALRAALTEARYAVRLTRGAENDLDDLRPRTERAIAELLQLEREPTKGFPLAGSQTGVRSLEFSLPGGGAYRAMYAELASERICLVFIIGAHDSIYEQAERRLRALRRAKRMPH